MRKTMQWFLLVAILIMIPALALGEALNTADELSAFLNAQREAGAADFTLDCSADLLNAIKADDFAQLKTLCEEAGVSSYAMRTTRAGKVFFSDVTYANPHAVECETEDEVRGALYRMLEQGGKELELHVNEALFQSLFREGRMYRLMHELGVDDFTLQGNSRYELFLTNVRRMTVPFAQVDSVNEAGAKMADWNGATAFNLLFDPDMRNAFTRDDYRLMTFLGGVESYNMSYNLQTGLVLFTDVVYSATPGVYCTSEEEVVTAIRAMGARGTTSFQLKLEESLYEAVKANQFARLYELQAQAGMTDSELRFSSSACLLLFDNAVISADVQVLKSLAEVTAYVESCAARGDSDIAMLLSADVYDALMEGVSALFASDARFYDLIANTGIQDAQGISFNRHSGTINLKGVQYYAGTNILRSLNDGSQLTDREQQALAAAQKLAADCARETPVQTAQAIHDALCAMITYTDNAETDEDDNCIGALLDGQANCDGYADAMLLVGKLAGLNVRYQHGDSLKSGLSGLMVTHMWNLIELDGTWRMIDVTWDDVEGGRLYQWFNIGRDRAALSHVWSEDMTVPMLAETDKASRPVAEYFVATAEDLTEAVMQAQQSGQKTFDLYIIPGSSMGRISAREAALQGLMGSVQYVWIDSLQCMHMETID